MESLMPRKGESPANLVKWSRLVHQAGKSLDKLKLPYVIIIGPIDRAASMTNILDPEKVTALMQNEIDFINAEEVEL